MKVYPDKLAEKLAQQLSPLYILTGEETLLMNEAADAIRHAARQQGFQEREIFYAEGKSFEWSPVLQSLNSLSLFSDKKIIEIHSNKSNLTADDFIQYWQRPNPDCLVIITTEKVDKKTQASKWFSALDRVGIHLEFWPLDEAQLGRWLSQRAKRQGLNIHPQGIPILQERTEGNLLASAQELEKLHLLFGNELITPEKLIDAISDSARYDVFKLTDAALAGNARNTLKILRGLLEEGTAETVIVWALTRELRILATTSDAVSQGQQSSGVLFKQGVWDKRQPLFLQALKRLNTRAIYQLLQTAHQIDLSIKGLGPKNSKDALEDLCLSLAGTG